MSYLDLDALLLFYPKNLQSRLEHGLLSLVEKIDTELHAS